MTPAKRLRRGKVAVSLPRELLDEIARIQALTGESRSAVFERAIAGFVAAADDARRAQDYMNAYRRHPELAGERRAAVARSIEALAAEPWDA